MLALAPTHPDGPDLAANRQNLLELDAELSVIAIRAAERALGVIQAGESGALPPLDKATAVLSADLEEVVRLAANRARGLGGVDGAIVELTDQAGGVHRLQVPGHAAGQRGTIAAVPDRTWRRPAESVLRLCADTETDPRVDREGCRRLGARSLMTVPLRHRRAALGATENDFQWSFGAFHGAKRHRELPPPLAIPAILSRASWRSVQRSARRRE